MINIRLNNYLWFVILAVVIGGCGGSSEPPTPEASDSDSQIATQIAIEKAVAATLTAEAPSPLPTEPPPQPTATPTSPAIPSPTQTSEATAGVAQETIPTPSMCQVVAQALNLRSGPGVIYDTLVTVLRDTELTPIGFTNAGFPGEWLQVQLPTNNNQIVWASAGPQFMECNFDFTTLPAAIAPPTPTPTVTNTPQSIPPTPTPTEEPFFVLPPPGGGGNEQVDGVLIFPTFRPGQLDPNNLIFRDRLAFRVVPYDVNTGRTEDGAGIERVEITISDDEEEVHYQDERSRAYCAFGGDEPACPAWVFADHDYTWPDGTPIKNTFYDVFILITPSHGETANWRFSFEIEGVSEIGEPAELVADIVQIGPNSTNPQVSEALVFQVLAYNPIVGNSDGAGIDNVDLRILRNGQVVYERTESNAKYCAFSGGEPDCNIWDFADNANEWPSGQPIEAGSHVLQATINAQNGQRKTIEQTIEIQP